MRTDTYLNFNGHCEDAFNFYAECFGGKVQSLMRWRDMPGGQCPPGMENRVMHAHLALGESAILGSDTPPANYAKPQGFSVTLTAPNAGEAERIFAALSQGGEVRMKMEKTFFAERFGVVTDRFAIPWMVMAGA